jgi:alkyl sulfatase BDS1-like metallo-beta-lactamase superfamily hydrolase
MKMPTRRSDEEKVADAAAKAERDAASAAQQEARRAQVAAHLATLPKFEYQVKRIGEDKQKGLLGSQRMEQILNGEGKIGWELVTINEERATFKRRLPA